MKDMMSKKIEKMNRYTIFLLLLFLGISSSFSQVGNDYVLEYQRNDTAEYIFMEYKQKWKMRIIANSRFEIITESYALGLAKVSVGDVSWVDEHTICLVDNKDHLLTCVQRNKLFLHAFIVYLNFTGTTFTLQDSFMRQGLNTIECHSFAEKNNCESSMLESLISDEMNKGNDRMKVFEVDYPASQNKEGEKSFYSLCDGIVTSVDRHQDQSLSVKIFHGSFYCYFYKLDSASVEIGEIIRSGEIIGAMGKKTSCELSRYN